MSTAEIVFDALQHVTFGSLSEFNSLGVLPLMAREDRAAGYSTLDEAMARGWMKITEVIEAGHVPELKVEIRATRRSSSSTARNWSAPSRIASST